MLQRSTTSSGTTLTVYAFGSEEHVYNASGAKLSDTYYYILGGRLLGQYNGVTTQFYLTDALGSVVSTFDDTVGSAAILGNQAYGPYGKKIYSAGSMGTNKGYTGQYQDATGLDYYNARYYDSVIGRFVSADSVQGNTSGMDPYDYVGGNPETATDPTGQRVDWGDGQQTNINWQTNTAYSYDNNHSDNVYQTNLQTGVSSVYKVNTYIAYAAYQKWRSSLNSAATKHSSYLTGAGGGNTGGNSCYPASKCGSSTPTNTTVTSAEMDNFDSALGALIGIAEIGLGAFESVAGDPEGLEAGVQQTSTSWESMQNDAEIISNDSGLTIDANQASPEEIAAAEYVASTRPNSQVVLRDPTGLRSTDGGTSDLLVDGTTYDVFSPNTSKANQVFSAVAGKYSQARGIVINLQNSSLTANDLGDVNSRVAGLLKSWGKDPSTIKDIIIYDPK